MAAFGVQVYQTIMGAVLDPDLYALLLDGDAFYEDPSAKRYNGIAKAQVAEYIVSVAYLDPLTVRSKVLTHHIDIGFRFREGREAHAPLRYVFLNCRVGTTSLVNYDAEIQVSVGLVEDDTIMARDIPFLFDELQTGITELQKLGESILKTHGDGNHG